LRDVFREASIAGIKEKLVDMKEVKAEYVPKKPVPVKVVLGKIIKDTDDVKPGQEPRSRGLVFLCHILLQTVLTLNIYIIP